MNLNAAWIDGPVPERTDKSCRDLGTLEKEIAALAAHPTSDLLAAGMGDGRVVILDATQQSEIANFQAHDQPITRLLFLPDGAHFATSSGDGSATVWTGEGVVVATMIAEAGILGLSYEPHTQRMAFAGMDKHATIWSPFEKGRLFALPMQSSPATSCQWLDEKTLLVGDAAGVLWVWNVELGVVLKRVKAHEQQITQIAVAPGGEWYATGSWDGAVRIRNRNHRERGECVRQDQPVTALTVAQGGKLLIVGHWDGGVRVWNSESGKTIDEFSVGGQALTSATVTADGQSYVTADNTGELRAWSTATLGVIQYLHRHSGEVYDLRYTTDNVNLLSVGWDGCLRLWDRTSCAEVGYVQAFEGPVAALATASDNTSWAVGCGDGTVRFWDVALQTFDVTLPVHKLAVSCIQFLPSGDRAIVGSWDNRLNQCAIKGQYVERWFDGHSKEIRACELSPDGRLMASASNDGSVRLWGLDENDEHARAKLVLEGHEGPVNECAFSPDGRWVASASVDRTVRIWSVDVLTEPHVLTGHLDEVVSVRYTPDGRLLLSADRSGRICFWNADTLELLGTLMHDHPVLCMAVAPDGLQAAIGDTLGFVRFFEVDYQAGPLWTAAVLEYRPPSLWEYGAPPVEAYRVSCVYCGAGADLAKAALGHPWKCPKCGTVVNVCAQPLSIGVPTY